MLPGALYAKELAGSDPYWECDTAVKTVTVAANQTATVTFSNTHNGRAKIIKSMPDGGSVAGWEFEVYSADNKLVGSFTTGEDGSVLTDYGKIDSVIGGTWFPKKSSLVFPIISWYYFIQCVQKRRDSK